jgi:hypothetical protein
LLLRVDEVRIRHVDLTGAGVDLFLANPGIDAVAPGARLADARASTSAASSSGLDQATAERGAVVVGDGDRDLANKLAEIGLRIEHAVKDRSDDDKAEGATVGEHAAPFADKAAGDAAAGTVRRDEFVLFLLALQRKLPQPPPGEGEDAERRPGEDREGRGRGVLRGAARRLVEQDLLVPAQRNTAPQARANPMICGRRTAIPGRSPSTLPTG